MAYKSCHDLFLERTSDAAAVKFIGRDPVRHELIEPQFVFGHNGGNECGAPDP